MSSYDGWLPPLTSHEPHQAHTTVDIIQFQPQPSHRCGDRSMQTPELEINLEAIVNFVSNNEEHGRLRGLLAHHVWITKCTPEHALQDTLKCFPYLASDGGRLTWKEKLHGGEESCSELSSHEEMVQQFSRFLSRMMKPGLRLGRYAIEMRIEKKIVIPKEDLKSWISWYHAKIESDPFFQFEFIEATSRPRTTQELLNETVKPRGGGLNLISSVDLDGFEASEAEKESAESCVFCMDQFSAGSNAIKLPKCSHVFHRQCLKKWLKESKECPICRSQVLPSTPSVDDVPILKQED